MGQNSNLFAYEENEETAPVGAKAKPKVAGIQAPDGLCCKTGEPCIHRMEYQGCRHNYGDELKGDPLLMCRVLADYFKRHPQTSEDEKYCVKPSKRKKVKK